MVKLINFIFNIVIKNRWFLITGASLLFEIVISLQVQSCKTNEHYA